MGISIDVYRARIGSYVRHSHNMTPDCWFSAEDDLTHLASQTAGSEKMNQVVLSISPKLASLLLLMIVLSAQCQAYLLIIGSVEQNPGPAAAAPVDVLARLSADAPSSEIRDCIRLYDQERDYTSNKKKLGTVSVATLVGVMTYLGVPGQDIYTKPTIVHNLICRIQNLLPETCPICSESYCVERDELGLLPCSICGQACHTPCLLGLLGIPEMDRSSFGPGEAKSKINPYNLPGIFYICKVCEESHIPSEEAGKRKKGPIQSTTIETVISEETSVSRQPVTSEDVQPHDLPDHTDNNVGPDNPPNLPPLQRHGTSQDQTNNGQTNSDQTRGRTDFSQVCPFYHKGTCRYGISGRGCPKLHPKPCRKMLAHGNRGPRGCNRGAQCDKYHPKMCPTSLKNGECLRETCKLRHVKGTRRVPLKRSDITQRTDLKKQNTVRERNNSSAQNHHHTVRERNNSSAQNHQVDFLAAIAALKTELLEAVDLKLRAAQSVAAGQASMTMVNPPHQHLCHQTHPCTYQGAGTTCRAPMPSTLVH